MLRDEPRLFWMIVNCIIVLLSIIWLGVAEELIGWQVWHDNYDYLYPLVIGIGVTTLFIHAIILMAFKED